MLQPRPARVGIPLTQAEENLVDDQGWTSILAGPIDEMKPAQKREQVIRAQTIAGIHTDHYVTSHRERAGRGMAAFRIASQFDPTKRTTEHCAALLFYLGFGDGKLMYCAGVSMDVVLLVQEVASAFEDVHGPYPTHGAFWGGQATGADESDHDRVEAWWQVRQEFFTRRLMNHRLGSAARVDES